ncbi:unnamed protein product [Rangifer tarandus platyrhynchus]|uniref:Uncharacterized protein n=1 Tax=Rangifer tarandus platyrhynchus TaxID=3082113 RepID=A0ABN8YAE9_RANTA|nr:unnamed protein product [Rangifer tarandus platyrhynchus]
MRRPRRAGARPSRRLQDPVAPPAEAEGAGAGRLSGLIYFSCLPLQPFPEGWVFTLFPPGLLLLSEQPPALIAERRQEPEPRRPDTTSIPGRQVPAPGVRCCTFASGRVDTARDLDSTRAPPPGFHCHLCPFRLIRPLLS